MYMSEIMKGERCLLTQMVFATGLSHGLRFKVDQKIEGLTYEKH